jgi:uncharacterized protein YjdB
MAKRFVFVLLAILVLFVSCSEDMFGTKEPTDISLSASLMEYETISDIRGKNLQLSATVTTKDGNTSSDNIVWLDMPTDISAFKVVSTSKGILTFQIYKSGTYVLTAGVKYRGEVTRTAQCVITIKDALVGLNIKERNSSAFDSKTLYVGNSLSLAVDYTPSDTSQTDVVWNVDNGDVLTITEQDGGKAIATAKKAGTAVVTAKSKDNNTVFDTVTINVLESGESQKLPVRSVSLEAKGGKDSVRIAETATLTATVTDGNSNVMTSGTVNFSLVGEDTTIATLQSASARSVQVYANKGGRITVHAEYTNDGVTVTADYPLTLTGDITSIVAESNTYNVAVDEEQEILIKYNTDILDTRKGYDFTLGSNLRVISYDNNKMVIKALEEGASKISFTSKHNKDLKTEVVINATTAVTEADRIHKVTLSSNSLNFYPVSGSFAEGSLSASVYRRGDDGKNAVDATKKVFWSISDSSVAVLVENDDNSVTIRPVAPGKATITAKSVDNETVSASATLTVNGTLSSLIAETSTINMSGGEIISIPLIAFPEYAIYSAPKIQCSNDNVSASIEKTDTGYSLYVQAQGLSGSTNIDVYVDGKLMTTVKVNVVILDNVVIRTIQLSSSSLSLKQDEDPVYVEAKALDKDGNEIETTILFKGDENAQSVSQVERVGSGNGFYIYPQNAGFADWFFYSDSAKTEARLHLEVGGGAVTETIRLKAQTDSISVVKGNSHEVKLNVLPFGTEFNENITWTVKDSAVANVTGKGLNATVFAIGKGTTTIQAESDSGLNATITVNVVEKAQVEDTNIAYVEITGNGSKTHIIDTTANKAYTLAAKAYKADGTEISNESFVWSLSGDVVKEVSSNKTSCTVRASEFGGYDNPAIITATSASNPSAKATFKVYVIAGSTVVEETNPKFMFAYSAITLQVGDNKSVDYIVLPTTYSEGMQVQLSSDCVAAILDQRARTITVTGLKAGNATVTLTNGEQSASFYVNVVEKAEKIDTNITSLTLSRSYLSYDIASKAPQSIAATVYKNGIASSEKVLWSVSDASLVSLTENGNSVLVSHSGKVGTVTITATAESNPDVKASCLVEIIDSTTIKQSLRYVMLSESVVELKKGQRVNLTASGQPASLFAEAVVSWKSSNEEVATVRNGNVKAVGVGEAVITVTADDKTATCKVIVSEDVVIPETPSSITLSENLLVLSQEDMDRTFDITATVKSSSGRTISDRNVTWSVEDPSGAVEYSVSYNTITLTPMSSGTATITAKMDDVEAQAKVVVGETYVDENLSDIILSFDALLLEIGGTSSLRATTIPASSEDNLLWELSNTNVTLTKTDSRNVVLKGVKEGTTTLTVSSLENPSIKRSMNITVKKVVDPNEVTAVKVEPSSIVLDFAEKSMTMLKATVYKGGQPSDGKVDWTYQNRLAGSIIFQSLDNIAFVSKSTTKQYEAFGYITAYSSENRSFSAQVFVQAIDSRNKEKTLSEAMLNSSAISLQEGDTYDFVVRTIPLDIKPTVTWIVSDTDVATIDQTGKLVTKKSGYCKVRALVTYNDKTIETSCNVSVYEKTEEVRVPSSIRFTKNVVYLSQEKMDESDSVTATVFDSSYAEMEDAEVVWTVADPTIVSIETDGNEVKISPLSAGKTTVKATYRNISNTITVVVGAKSEVLVDKVANIVFDSDSIVMAKGSTKTVKATVVPAGIDDSVSYTISNPDVVEIVANKDNSVTLTAKQAGTAVLTATSVAEPALKAEMTITVSETTEDVITAIKLDKNYITFGMDEKALTELKATVYVNDKATKNVNVSWSLEGLDETQLLYTPSDTYASSVYLTKKAAGAGYIVAKAGEVSARCYVEIVESSAVDSLKDIILSDEKLVLRRNQSYTVSTTMVPDNIVTDIAWTTSDNTIAVVNSNGTITGLSEGNAVITAHSYKYDIHKEVQVEVKPDDIENVKASFIRLSVQTVELSQTDGKTKDVVATVIGTDGEPISGATVTWAMDSEDVASMTVEGNTVTLGALNTGKTNLRAYYGSLSASASVYTGMVPGEDVKTLDHISLEPSVLTIQTGREGVLNASSYPAGLDIVPVWESADSSIAFVKAGEENSAYVTAVKEGNTTVTVKDKLTEKTATAKVRVMDDISTAITGVTLDKSSITLDINDPDTGVVVNANVYVANTLDPSQPVMWGFASEEGDDGVIYFIENDAKARGITIKPYAEGKGYLRAFAMNDPSVYAQVYVRVIDSTTVVNTPSYIKLSKSAVYLSQEKMDEFDTITASVHTSSDAKLDGAEVVWTVDNPEVARIEAEGNEVKVYPLSTGKTTIKATYRNISNSITVIVGAKSAVLVDKVTNIVFESDNIVMAKGESRTVKASVLPAGINDNVIYTINSTECAEIKANDDNTVTITAKQAGSAVLTATSVADSSLKAQMTIKVQESTENVVTAIKLDKNYISLALDEKALTELKATVYVNNVATNNVNVTWSLEGLDETQIAYTPSDAFASSVFLTKKAVGSGYVVARVDDMYARCYVEIVENSVVEGLKDIVLSDSELTLKVNQSHTVTTTMIPEGVSADITWTTSDNTVATVSAKGTITAVGEGVATITAHSYKYDIHKEVQVKVYTSSITELRLEVDSITMEKGDTRKIKAITTPSDITADVRWAVEEGADVVSVDVYGNITAKAQGNAVVKAYVYGSASLYDTVSITVIDPDKGEVSTYDIGSITITPSSAILAQDAKLPTAFTAKVYDRNGKAINEENVEWDTTDLGDIAEVTRTEGNTIYLMGKNAGRGTLTAKRTSLDGSVVSKTVDIYTGEASVDPVEETKASFVRLSVQTVELSQTDGKTKNVVATVYTTEGEIVEGATVTWALDNENIASMEVNENTVTLGALNTGVTTLRAYYGTLSASASVYVGVVPGEDVKTLDHITATPSVLTIQTGTEGELSVAPFPAGIELNVNWQAEDTTIATVKAGENSAAVAGVKQGRTTVTAKDVNTEKSSTVSVRVLDDISTAVTGVVLDKESLTIDLNSSAVQAAIKAMVYVANVYNASSEVEWAFYNETLTEESDIVELTVLDKTSVSVKGVKAGSGYLRATAKDDSEVYAQAFVRVIDSKTIARTITEIRLETDAITMEKGASRKISAITTPSDLTADIRWGVVEGKDVVSVDAYGNISAKAKGSAIVKVYVFDKPELFATIAVTVVEPGSTALESIAFDSSSPVYLVLGDKKQIKVNYRPNDASVKGLVWTLKNDAGFISSSMNDEGIAVKALAVTSEDPIITATSIAKNADGKNLSTELQVKVVETKEDLPAVTDLVLDKTAIVLNLNTKSDVTVTATGYDYEGNKVENAKITWALEENAGTDVSLTASIGQGIGINKGTKTGTVKLVATCGEVKAYCAIEVKDTTSFSGISLSSDVVYLTVGSSYNLTVYGSPSSMFKGAIVSLGGDADSVKVTPDANNKVFYIEAVKKGAANLRFIAEVSGKIYSADAVVYVNDVDSLGVSKISLNPSSAYIQVGKTAEFEARLYDKKGDEVFAEVDFSITDPSVASLFAEDNKVTVEGLSAGTATIYAKSGDAEALAFVSVGKEAEPVVVDTTLVKIIPGMSQITLKKGEVVKVNISTVPSDNTDVITGLSSQENVATIFVDGREATITAIGNGSAILTLTNGTITETIEVKVAGVAVASRIELDKTSVSLDQTASANETVSAKVYSTDGVEMAVKIESWTTDDESIVSLTDLGNNSVNVTPKNSGNTHVWAHYGDLKTGFRVAVSEKQSLATGPSSITIATPSLTLKAGDSETVSVLYQPNGLSDSAKGIKWTSSNSAVATVEGVGTGETATITAVGVGKATLTATAVSSSNVFASMTVEVLSSGSLEDVYKISLDKNSVRMNPQTDVVIKATLTKNGEKVDASEVLWTFESNEIDVNFVRSASELAQDYKGHTATIRAKDKTGYAYIIATYGGASEKIQVEVADLEVVEDTGLRSVIISDKTMLMEVGEKATFKAAVNPSVTGVKYVWTQTTAEGKAITNASDNYVNLVSQSGSSITVSAVKAGTVVLNLDAVLDTFPAVNDSVTIQILEKGATSASYNYSSVKMSASTLDLAQTSDYSYITATLVDTEKKDTEDAISKWALLNERGEEILYWENGKYVYEGNKYSSFTEILLTTDLAGKSFSEINDFSVIGADNRMIRLVPGKAGIYFVEAYGPEEGSKENPVRVSARTMINVSGSISAVTFSSSYVHLVKGASTTITVSKDPVTAKLKDYKWTAGDKLELTEETHENVIVTGTELGDAELAYTATDINGKTVSCKMQITVHDISWGTGGIKQVSFPESFVTLGFPYTAQSYKAEAYYMDGTTVSGANITYKKQVNNNGVWTDVTDSSSIVKDGKVIATYTESEKGVITITPVEKGEFRVVAELTHNGQSYSSEMYVSIGGNSNTLTSSSSSVVLYTGGSASVSLKLDNPAYESGFFAQIIEEKTADGYVIENGVIKATGEKMAEALKIANADEKGIINATELVLGSKILVTNKTSQAELNSLKSKLGMSDDEFIGLDADYTSDSFKRILKTFPRTATVRVTTLDGQSSTDIAVTIRRLPEGNSYPLSIKLSAEKVDLQPPFTAEQTIKATLYDQLGNETSGTVEWYFYPIGASYTDTEDGVAKWKLDTAKKNETDEISAYFNGKTMYYTPKKAGLYRLLVLCKQNPQLSYEATINVAGDVTGVSSSVGKNLNVAKNSWAEVSAVFEPTNALARNVVFAVDEVAWTGVFKSNTIARLLNPDAVYQNSYIKVSVVDNTATIAGLTGTSSKNSQRLRILYGKTTEDQTKLENAYRKGYAVQLIGKEQFQVVNSAGSQVYDSAGDPITLNAYYDIVNINVTVTKALYSFSTQSSRSINPSALENGKISFDFTSTATSEDGSSSVSPFSRWDWLECRIVGDESGYVYASTVPVDKYGHSVYQDKDGNWYYYDEAGTTEKVDALTTSSFLKGAKYYNSQKVEYTYTNSSDENFPVLFSNGKAYIVNAKYEKVFLTNKDNTSVSTSQLDTASEADSGSYSTANGSVTWTKTSVPLATKSSDSSGKIDTDNGGSTFFFKLNSDAIPDETLRIVVRLRDDVKYSNVETYGYDIESVQINENSLALSIGGKIQNIYTGTVIRENHGSTVSETLTENIEQIKMFEGASVTLIPTYNPTSTHQKGIKWELQGISQSGDSVPQSELESWIKYSDLEASQLMITAKAFGTVTENDHRIVYAVARSTTDASVYCRYEIDIQTMIKSLTFTSVGQVQTNKNITEGVFSSPIYKNVATTNSSNQSTQSMADIYCFDTIDVSGGGGNIDAYYISYDLVPDYGYDLSVELLDNSAKGTSQLIGTIDTTGIADDVKAFRFIPTGRIYSEYDDDGNGIGSYTVAYGDVKMRVYNSQINYSKEFTIHYMPSSFRLVKHVETLADETSSARSAGSIFTYGKGQFTPQDLSVATQDELYESWDYLWEDTTKTLQGMECVVLYEATYDATGKLVKAGETIDLSFAGTTILSAVDSVGNMQNKTVLQYYADPTSISEYKDGVPVNTQDGKITDIITVGWSLIQSKDNAVPTDVACFVDEEGNEIGTEYTSDSLNVASIKANKSGTAYLQYSIKYQLIDSDGKVIKTSKILEDGSTLEEPQTVTITSGVPVYVISNVNPELMLLIQKSLTAYPFLSGVNVSALIPERLSRCQIDKWYAVSSASSLTDIDGEIIEGAIYTGRAYATFTKTSDAGAMVGQTSVLGIENVGKKIETATQQTDENRGVTINLGSTYIKSICEALWESSSSVFATNIQSKDYLGTTDWVVKDYKDIDLRDLSKVKWVTGLTIDMTKLQENEKYKDYNISLASLLSKTTGNFSSTGVNRISITGDSADRAKYYLGISYLSIPSNSICTSGSITLNNVLFKAFASNVQISGKIKTFTAINVAKADSFGSCRFVVTTSEKDSAVKISNSVVDSWLIKNSDEGSIASLTLSGVGIVTFKDCNIGSEINGDSFTGDLTFLSCSFTDPKATSIKLPKASSLYLVGDCGTSGYKELSSLDLSGNTDINELYLGDCRINKLNLTDCKGLYSSIQYAWNNWKVSNLIIPNTTWTSVSIDNTYMSSLDISGAKDLRKLNVNTASERTNFRTIKANNCALVVVNVYISANDSAGGLYLGNNKLGVDYTTNGFPDYEKTCDNTLTINGKNISLGWPASTNLTCSKSKDFASEWDGLENLKVDLSNNKICYSAGFASTEEDGTWTITIKVRAAGTQADKYIVSYRTSAPEEDTLIKKKQFSFTGKLIVNESEIKKIGVEDCLNTSLTYTLSDIGCSSNTTITFKNVREKSVSGFEIMYARGPDIYVYPFGEDSL